MEFKNLLIEITDGVAILTVNRPKSLNALNSEVVTELGCALHGFEQDTAVKVVIVTGAGEKAFVAGGDIKEMTVLNSSQAHALAHNGQQVVLSIKRMKKPVIAAVNGFALGGGLELALACDFIYASDNAMFGLPEVTLGVIPGFGGTQNLARLIGTNKTNELIFTGKKITAQKACTWGIVNEVFPASELIAKSMEAAEAISKNGLMAVGYAKDAVANGLSMTREDGFRYEATLFALLFATEDQKEGMNAFAEKRRADFKGR